MTGAELIAKERQRQIEEEGWTAEHDDFEHEGGGLIRAAVAYADCNPIMKRREQSFVLKDVRADCVMYADPWPWDGWDKRKTHPTIRRLVIAGALIAAEIDRLQRAQG